MPATPKPPGQRRRRNAGQPQWKELPASGRQGAIPKLPTRKPAWSKSTRDWWARIWSSPMATIWHESDFDGLLRLADLKEGLHRGDVSIGAHGIITALEDRFGLSPGARRRLQWEIKQAEVVDLPQPEERRKLRAVG